MTSDGEALLRAVGEDPWDDTPRLVYADWLEEHGQPLRAAYIRLEIEVERQLARRERLSPEQVARRQELAQVAWRWVRELPRLSGVSWASGFSRGFPCRASVSSAANFLRQADAIYAAAPVTMLKLGSFSKATLLDLPASPLLKRLTMLDLNGCRFGDDGVKAIVVSPHLSRLRVLRLSHTDMGDAGAEALARSANLPALEVLYIEGTRVTNRGARAIAESPHLPRLVDVFRERSLIGPLGHEMLNAMREARRAQLPDWTSPETG